MADTLIIIPTYNEKENIERFICEIFRYVSDIDILIVDDNSPDGTGAIADRIAQKDKRVSVLHRMSRRGRGYAGVDTFKEALKRKDILYIMEMDADLSHDPRHIPNFLKEIKQNDIVIGSRFVEGGSDTERSLLRNFFSRAANWFIRKYLGLDVGDCSAGYRCFRRHVIDSLDLDSLISRGPAIIEEVLYASDLKRFKIKEMPIIFRARHRGRTKLTFVKLLGVLVDIIRFKNRTGHTLRANPDKVGVSRELRDFGFRFGLALNILGCIMFYRQRAHFIWFTGIGSLNLIFAIACPRILVSVKRILDFVILWIGRVINAVSLMAVFYLIFTPVGISLKFFRKDLLHQKIDKTAASYWIKGRIDAFSKASYERMG